MSPGAVLTIVATVGALTFEGLDRRPGVWVCKPLAASGFLWAALSWGALSHTYGQWIFAGLCLSWVGDMALMRRTKGFFLFGLSAFLLGHVAYIGAFAARGLDLTALAWATAPMILGALVVARMLKGHVRGGMVWPVRAYMLVITVMATLAWGTFGYAPDWLITAGATAFWASDISVARDRFMGAGFGNRLWGVPAYFGGQLLLAWSVAS
ncbi:MAG: lysoplasmalogenase [Bradymonadia bacterium]